MSASFTSFRCPHCHTEIQASPDMIGQQAECPACGTSITIPPDESDGVRRHDMDDTDESLVNAMKSRTIRIDLGDL